MGSTVQTAVSDLSHGLGGQGEGGRRVLPSRYTPGFDYATLIKCQKCALRKFK